jgi:hypothetical protein
MKLNELEKLIEGAIMEEGDKLAKARQLENALVNAWNGEQPDAFQSLSKAIVDDLKPKISGDAEMVPTEPITKRWIEFGGSDKTPKADIRLGKYKTSVKMGSGQFMSGQKGEATATLLCSLEDSGIYNLQGFTKEVVTELDKLENDLIFKSSARALKGAIKKKDSSTDFTSDEQLMVERLSIQEKVKQYLDEVTDPETNPDVKYYFLREAMTGVAKFGKESPATANALLSVASKETIYGKEKKSIGKRAGGVVSVDPTFEIIDDFYNFSPVDRKLIDSYIPLVKLSVKFKSGSIKEEGKTVGTKAREVVGLLFDESDKFKKSLKAAINQLNESQDFHLDEGLLDDIKSGIASFKDFLFALPSQAANKIKSVYKSFVEKIKKGFDIIKKAIIDIAQQGINAVLNFFNLTPIVRFEDEINFSSVAMSANESLTKSKITYKMLEQMVEEAIKKAR